MNSFYDNFSFESNQDSLQDSYSFEARNILKDSQLRINTTSNSIYTKAYGENIIIFSLTTDFRKSLNLFGDLIRGKGGLLIPKLKNLYFPYKGIFKLPGKSIIDNYNSLLKETQEEGIKFGIKNIFVRETLLTNFSTMYDLSRELNTLKKYTVDKTMNSMTIQRREYILNLIKDRITKFPSNPKLKFSNKVVFIEGPFFEGTKIKLTIQNNMMLNIFNPGLLILEWLYNDIEGFKRFISDNKVTFVFRSAKDKRTLILAPNKALNTKLFNPAFIFKVLHKLDGTEDPEIDNDLTDEELEAFTENGKGSTVDPDLDPNTDVGLKSQDEIDNLNKDQGELEKNVKEISLNNDDFDDEVHRSDDSVNQLIEENNKFNSESTENFDTIDGVASIDDFEKMQDLEDENIEVQRRIEENNEESIFETEQDTLDNMGIDFVFRRNNAVGSLDEILKDERLNEHEKVDKISEVHNYSDIKRSIETPEVKKLKSKLQSTYGRKVEDVVREIKTHKVKSTTFKDMEQSVYSKSNFINIESGYNDVIGKSDFEEVITSPMNSSNAPMFLTSYKEKKNSNREFYGKTVTMTYKDTTGKEHEVTLDIPESINGKMLIGGSLKQLNLQDASKPVIKTDEDVIITTSYNKTFLSLKGTFGSMKNKRLVMSIYEFIKNGGVGFVSKTTTELGNFIYNNLVSYELIHLNRYFNKFIMEGILVDFRGFVNHSNIDPKMEITYYISNSANEVEESITVENLTVLGHINEQFIFHDPEENLYYIPSYYKVKGKIKETYVRTDSINEFIIRLVDKSIKTIKDESKSATQYKLFRRIFSRVETRAVTPSKVNAVYAKIMSRDIPVIFLMLTASPLNELLERLKKETGLEYKIVKGTYKPELDSWISKNPDTMASLTFADGTSLIVKYNNTLNEILLSPLMALDMSSEDIFNISNIIRAQMDSSTTIIYIENFVDFFLNDPTTKRILSLYNIPTDFVGVLIYAASLFTTHKTHFKSDSENFRLVTTSEVINRCLYDVLSKEFSGNAARVKMASRSRISIPRDAVVKKIQELPNMSEYSVMSPFRSIMRDRKKSAKGQMGTNNSRAFDTTLRMFHDNNIGAETASTPYSGEAGVTKTLPVNPSIDSISGEYKHLTMEEAYEDPSKVLSFIESYVPYLYHDHIIRAMMADNQFDHALPVKDGDPMCISYGADESAAYIAPNFSTVAEEDGEIISSNNSFTKIKYKSGKIDIIGMDDDERNADKGYFVPNKMTLAKGLKVGSKFKKGDLVVYNKNFFKPKSNGRVGLTAGPIAMVAIMDSEGTWEDACIPFDSLSEKLTTSISKRVARKMSINTEIRDFRTDLFSEVNADDVLYKYRVLEEDAAMNDFFVMDEDLTMQDVTAHNHGIIKDIRVYYRTARDISMSESMKTFIKKVELSQKQYNNAGDLKDVTDEYKKVKYNKLPLELTNGPMSKINGDLIENGEVLIEYYIESKFKLGSGDKLVVDRALKGEPSDVLPDELRPVGLDSGRRGELLFNTYSLLARITPGMILHGTLISIMRHIAIKNRMILNRKPEPGHRLDYKSSMDMVEGKWKYKD